MKYLKNFETFNIKNSTYKVGDIVKIIDADTDDVGKIKECGVVNTRYIYTIQTPQGRSIMRYYFDNDIVPATKYEKDLYISLETAEKYNL
jgi:hypothetical protein